MKELMEQWEEVQRVWAAAQQRYADANNFVAAFHAKLSQLQMSDADFDDKEKAAAGLAREAKAVAKALGRMVD
jgi:putative IMPACT (imprinted ancient) family translation regulator